MALIVYPVAASPGSVRVWVGVKGQNAPPNIRFEFDGVPRVPTSIRAMAPIRDATLVANPGMRRVFSGLYEFGGVGATEATHRVRVTTGAASKVQSVWSIPDAIPDNGLNVFLTSCFHLQQANGGAIHSAVESMKKRCTLASSQTNIAARSPHFSILMGDQVYLDLPTIGDLPSGRQPLAAIFEERYLNNWGGGPASKSFDRILGAAPFFALSDDHEFWNNYPHRSPIIQNSWTAEGRDNWRAVSKAMFRGFQAANPQAPSDPIRVDLNEVSFLLIDTRFGRLDDTFLPPGSLAAITAWVDSLNAQNRIGVIVTGQSLYAGAAGSFTGAVADYEYPDYDDFPSVVEQLARIKPPLICLTGDVHWGRVVKSISRHPAHRGNVYEVITSPLALVSTIGRDQRRTAFNAVRRFFGGGAPWPRHTQPAADELSSRAFANSLQRPNDPTPYTHFVMEGRDAAGRNKQSLLKGDQISLLSFTKNAAGRITASVRYWSVDSKVDKPALTVRLFDYSVSN